MSKIIIKKNPNGDTRTAPKGITFEAFQIANNLHIRDVEKTMDMLAKRLIRQSHDHDWTKKYFEHEFYNDFTNVMQNGGDFTQMNWYQGHIHSEKHHPLSYLHEDYNLLDLLETICDCVCAGLARSGEVRPLEFDDKIVKLAIDNTVKLLLDNIEVED